MEFFSFVGSTILLALWVLDRTLSQWCHPSLARFTLARVSLTRASLARFTLTRSQFGHRLFLVSGSARFTLARCQFGAFPSFVPNCTEVFSTPVWHVSRFEPMVIEYTSMACSTRSIYICGHVSAKKCFFMRARISFLRIFPLCIVHYLFINLVNVSSRLHHSGLVY